MIISIIGVSIMGLGIYSLGSFMGYRKGYEEGNKNLPSIDLQSELVAKSSLLSDKGEEEVLKKYN